MLGAIIGDVVGSYYEVLEIEYYRKYKVSRPYEERIKILDKDTPLFTDNCSCTDDSILTCAIYDAIKNGNGNYEKYLRDYGLREINAGLDKYGRSRFGKGFVAWLKNEKEGNSYGNGAAMRISPVGYLYDNINDVKHESFLATIPSHNNIDAIKSAEAVAVSIFMLRNGISKNKLKEYIVNNYYNLSFNLESLQRNYKFSSKAINSVPQALFVFFESNDFEDAIRKAISIGGDSDTIACIVGSLAEACYGIPEQIKKEVKPYLKDYMLDLLSDEYYNDKIKCLRSDKND